MKLDGLLLDINPISSQTTIEEVGDLLLNNKDYHKLLSLPVVEDNIPVGIISRYQLMNVFMKRFGRDLFGKKTIGDLMNPQPIMVDLKQNLQAVTQYITNNISFPITEDFIIVDDGKYAGIGMVIDLLRHMEANVERKNTDLSRAIKHLKQSQSQLVQSEKMASLGQMVAGVAHEINTPLGYVKGNIEIISDITRQLKSVAVEQNQLIKKINDLRHDTRLNPECRQVFESVDISEHHEAIALLNDVDDLFGDTLYGLEQITELVLSLKDFSRLDKSKVDNINLNDCLNNALLIAKNSIKHKAEVVKKLDELPMIKCSPSQINQVFLNLFTNAAQAIEENGRILIKSFIKDSFINIVVEDNGKGIQQQHLAKIFDPFFTTKEVGKGTGMGLSISYKIIKDHGGDIRVASKPGTGTRFLVRLPFVNEIKLAS